MRKELNKDKNKLVKENYELDKEERNSRRMEVLREGGDSYTRKRKCWRRTVPRASAEKGKEEMLLF